jgi:predicted dehydrogenase
VSNPTALHLEVAIPAARAGSHLLLEKPISHTNDGLAELVDAVERKRLKVLVGFQFRFHPGLNEVKRVLDEGAIGEVVSAHAHWGEYLPDWHPEEDFTQGYSARADLGGGVVLTLCHPFDYLRWLLGEVVQVSGLVGSAGLGLEVEDTAHVTLRFESGVTGTVHLDYVQRPPSHWLRIAGTDGTLIWDNGDGSVRLWRASSPDGELIAPPEGFERNTMFLEEMRHFLACLEGLAEPKITLEDGLRALRIALAVKRSAREGRVVELPDE